MQTEHIPDTEPATPDTGSVFGASYAHHLVIFLRRTFYHSGKIKAKKEYPITNNVK